MFERFTERARKVMSLGRQEAQRLNADAIGPEHILLGLLQEGGGAAWKALHQLSETLPNMRAVRQEIEKLSTPSSSPSVSLGQIPFTVRAKKVLELAEESSVRLGCEVVGTEHLLLGILADGDGLPCQILKNIGIELAVVRDKVLEVIGAEAAMSCPERIELPNGAELQEMMTRVSTLIEGINVRMAKLAKEYGVHSDLLPIGGAVVRLTRVGDRWGIECQRGTAPAELITGCRFDDKLEFLAKAKQFEGLYRSKILALHRRAKSVIENHLKDEE